LTISDWAQNLRSRQRAQNVR